MTSPFHEHFGTNYVPSTQELEDIKCILDETSQEIRRIDIEIAELCEQLNRLREKRSRACSFMDQHRALMSPIRRISQDVLEEIFLACLPQDRNSCIVTTEAPLLLTHVCKSWRSIAHSLPRLWSSIHIALPTFRSGVYAMSWRSPEFSLQEELLSQKLEELQAIADEWMLRSRGCQPSISIFRRRPNYYAGNDSQVSVVEERENQAHISFVTYILRPRLHCWHKIELCLSQKIIIRVFLDETVHSNMPALRHFHLRSLKLEASFILNFITPGLVSLSLRGFSLKKADLSHITPSVWKQLKSLDFDVQLSGDPKFPTMLDIAHSIIYLCHALETLKIHVADQIRYRTTSRKPHEIKAIILPKLTSFTLDQPIISLEVARFLVKLQLPALKELKLPLPRSNADELMETMLKYSGSTLSSLGFYCDSGRHPMSYPHDFRSVLQYLRMTPNLRCFKLSSGPSFPAKDRWIFPVPLQDTYNIDAKILIGDDLIYALSPAGKEYSGIVCPQLQVLDCDREFITGVSQEVLKECIKARNSAHVLDSRIVPIQTVRVFIDEDRQTESEKVSLGEGSAVYFRKAIEEAKVLLYSPLGGFVPMETNHFRGVRPLFSDAYTDL